MLWKYLFGPDEEPQQSTQEMGQVLGVSLFGGPKPADGPTVSEETAPASSEATEPTTPATDKAPAFWDIPEPKAEASVGTSATPDQIAGVASNDTNTPAPFGLDKVEANPVSDSSGAVNIAINRPETKPAEATDLVTPSDGDAQALTEAREALSGLDAKEEVAPSAEAETTSSFSAEVGNQVEETSTPEVKMEAPLKEVNVENTRSDLEEINRQKERAAAQEQAWSQYMADRDRVAAELQKLLVAEELYEQNRAQVEAEGASLATKRAELEKQIHRDAPADLIEGGSMNKI